MYIFVRTFVLYFVLYFVSGLYLAVSGVQIHQIQPYQPPLQIRWIRIMHVGARPSGVGLGRRAGTVASARTRLGRPEEQQAERAGAADASTLPPSSRRKVKHC